MIMLMFYTLLVTLDYITGIAGAFVSSRIDSKITRTGLIRKSIMLMVLWSVWYFANVFIPTYIDPNFILPFDSLESLILSGFVIYEVISFIENLGILGVKIPPVVANAFARLQEYSDSNELPPKD